MCQPVYKGCQGVRSPTSTDFTGFPQYKSRGAFARSGQRIVTVPFNVINDLHCEEWRLSRDWPRASGSPCGCVSPIEAERSAVLDSCVRPRRRMSYGAHVEQAGQRAPSQTPMRQLSRRKRCRIIGSGAFKPRPVRRSRSRLARRRRRWCPRPRPLQSWYSARSVASRGTQCRAR